MRKSVLFEIAGARLRLDGLPIPDRSFLEAHYPGFYRVGRENADLVLSCLLEEDLELPPPPAPGMPPVVSVEELAPGRLRTVSHWHRAELDLGAGSGEAVFTDGSEVRFRLSLENLLRAAFANLLLRRGAFLLHAAAIVRDGRAWVFLSLAGGGKSTLAQLSRPLPALSDDLAAIGFGAGGLSAVRVPFYGSFPPEERLEGRYPVAGFWAIARGDGHAVETLSRAAQVLRLRSCMPFLPPGDERAMRIAERAVEACPVAGLRFAPDAGFWRLLAP